MVDALDSGSSGREFVEVRVLSRAPDTSKNKNQKSIRTLKLLGVLFLFLIKLLEKKTAGLGRRFKFFLN